MEAAILEILRLYKNLDESIKIKKFLSYQYNTTDS